MSFINLYLETEYSMLESTIKLEELFSFSKKENISTLAICDYANMHGAFKFYKAAKANNIKPLFGLSFNLNNEHGLKNRMIVFARNNNGYQNLLKLATAAKMNKDISYTFLKTVNKDLLAIIPSFENDIGSLVLENRYTEAVQKLELLKNIFSDLYFGLSMQSENQRSFINKLYSFASDNKIKAVALNKTTYFKKEDFEVYRVLKSISLGIVDYPYDEEELNQFFILEKDINKLFVNYPELIKNTTEISDKCSVTLEYKEHFFPSFIDAKGKSYKYLSDLCKLGLNKRLKDLSVDVDKYVKRLLYELEVINKMGYCDYFLVVYDFIKYAKQNDILVGPGRGSAPGSLVAYSLGITDIDPIKYDLLFERFLNPERITMPDIDTDFPDNKRDDVINYVSNKYGSDKVASIITFGTYGPRLAIRDVARVYKTSDVVLNEILKHVSTNDKSIKDCILSNDVFLKLVSDNSEVKKIVEVVKKMEGLPRHSSTHAAGIVMSKNSLMEYVPLQAGLNNTMQTQFEASDLEEIGLVKMDFLGIKNLTIIEDVVNKVKEIDKKFDLSNIPMDDALTYKMIAAGDTDGIFQLESAGMRKVLISLKTSEFMDIVNANALYRPGPMDMIPSFVNRKFKKEKIDYIDDSLKDILTPTYGTIVFQEQIMMIVQKFAGYSLGMADILRRAISKKDPKVIEQERLNFVNGASKLGHSSDVSNRVYDYIVKFGNYGFNKSHSVAYSMVAYQMAYLKRHYYRFFITTLMSNSIGSTTSIRNYLIDCKKKGVKVNLPSINYSGAEFSVYNNEIYFSLLGINNLGALTLNNFLEERKLNGLYKSYQEFITRTKEILNKRIVENLIHAGALDEFKIPRKQMILEYDNSLNIAKFNVYLEEGLLKKEYLDEEYTYEEISLHEREALGFNFKYSIFMKYQDLIKKYKVVSLNNLSLGSSVNIVFQIKEIKQIKTKANQDMAFVSGIDEDGEIDIVFFPATYEKYRNILKVNSVYIAEGKVEERNEKLQFIPSALKLI